MTDDTLLAHLSPRFTNRTEDIAVRALWYILSKSEMARNALEETLKTGGANVGRIVRLKIEATGDNQERPDLVAFDDDGVKHVLIEAKFEAGLTPNQPGEYLKSLLKVKDRPSALLFVAPEWRREVLWANLRQRVSESNSISLGDDTREGVIWSTSAGKNRHLLLTSWRHLLCSMKAKANGETSVMCDIQQLQGLCERMDSEAFPPLQPDELSPEFPKRILSLNRLVDKAIAKAKEGGFVHQDRRSPYIEQDLIGQYIWFGEERVHAWFGVSFHLWANHRETPVWLIFGWFSENIIEKLRRALEPLRQKEPPGVIDIDERGPSRYSETMNIPIDIKTGVEYDEVLDAVVEQLRRVAELIGSKTN